MKGNYTSYVVEVSGYISVVWCTLHLSIKQLLGLSHGSHNLMKSVKVTTWLVVVMLSVLMLIPIILLEQRMSDLSVV